MSDQYPQTSSGGTIDQEPLSLASIGLATPLFIVIVNELAKIGLSRFEIRTRRWRGIKWAHKDAVPEEIDDLFVLTDVPVEISSGPGFLDKAFEKLKADTFFVASLSSVDELENIISERINRPLDDTERQRLSQNFDIIRAQATVDSACDERPEFEAPDPAPASVRLNLYPRSDYEEDPENPQLLRPRELIRMIAVPSDKPFVFPKTGKVDFMLSGQVVCQSVEKPNRVWFPRLSSFDRRYEPAGTTLTQA